MEYFYFGMETMRITQSYRGSISHLNHIKGDPKDYPIDCAGSGSGQSAYFVPVDMKVVEIKGVGSSATNTIWLESVDKVNTPTFTDYVWLTLTHWNDNSLTAKYKVGNIIKKGSIVAYEGTDGAKSNHLHVVCGRGKCNNWVKNSKGSWVMNGTSLPPEEVMYVNENFTKVVNSGSLNWSKMPKVEYFEKCSNSYTSIVDALKSINVESIFSNRKKIAIANGIENYLGTSNQNIRLLTLLKNGKLIKPR